MIADFSRGGTLGAARDLLADCATEHACTSKDEQLDGDAATLRLKMAQHLADAAINPLWRGTASRHYLFHRDSTKLNTMRKRVLQRARKLVTPRLLRDNAALTQAGTAAVDIGLSVLLPGPIGSLLGAGFNEVMAAVVAACDKSCSSQLSSAVTQLQTAYANLQAYANQLNAYSAQVGQLFALHERILQYLGAQISPENITAIDQAVVAFLNSKQTNALTAASVAQATQLYNTIKTYLTDYYDIMNSSDLTSTLAGYTGKYDFSPPPSAALSKQWPTMSQLAKFEALTWDPGMLMYAEAYANNSNFYPPQTAKDQQNIAWLAQKYFQPGGAPPFKSLLQPLVSAGANATQDDFEADLLLQLTSPDYYNAVNHLEFPQDISTQQDAFGPARSQSARLVLLDPLRRSVMWDAQPGSRRNPLRQRERWALDRLVEDRLGTGVLREIASDHGMECQYDDVSSLSFSGSLRPGTFYSSSLLQAKIVPSAPWFGEVELSDTPFQISINGSKGRGRASVSLVHELVHVMDRLFKLGLSHDQVHGLAIFMTGEVIPAINAFSVFA